MPKKIYYEKYLKKGLCGKCGGNKEKDRQHLTTCYSCYQKTKTRMTKSKDKYNKKRRVEKNKYNRYNRTAKREKISYISEKALFYEALFPDGIYLTEKVINLGKFLKGEQYNKNTDGLIRTWLFNPNRFPNNENKYKINDYFNEEIFKNVGWRPIVKVKVISNENCEYYAGITKIAGVSIVRWTEHIKDAIHYNGDTVSIMSQINTAFRLIKSVNKNINVKVNDVQLRMS